MLRHDPSFEAGKEFRRLGHPPSTIRLAINHREILGLYNGAFDWDGRETKTEKMIERTRAPLVAVTVRA